LLMLNNGRIHIQGSPAEVLQFHTIERVYRTVVVTSPNPVTGSPTVFLVPGDQIIKLKQMT